MKRKFIWLGMLAALVLSIFLASLLETSKVPSRSDGEYVIVRAALKPMLQELEQGRAGKDGSSIPAISDARKQEMMRASEGLLSDVQISNEGAVLLEIRSTARPGNIRLRLVPDRRAGTGWSCEGLSDGAIPSPCRRTLTR